MKLAMLVLAFVLVSCGENSDSPSKNRQEEQERIPCGGKSMDCMSAVDWSMELNSTDHLPENIGIFINDRRAATHCRDAKGINFSLTPQGKTIMNFSYWYWPSDFFKVEIRDVGEDCRNNASFQIIDHPVYSTSVFTVEGRRHKSVYVNFEN